MGTRAQFFIGNPSNLEEREYLGTIAWDGYPDGVCGDALENITTVEGFRKAINSLAKKREDFADPAKHSFPFPWKDDLYLTDCTYAFFGGAVQFTWFHHGFVPLRDYLSYSEEQSESYHDVPDQLPSNVPAPTSEKPPGADSIMVLRLG